jgi:polysaccharide biosynthesis/export protein
MKNAFLTLCLICCSPLLRAQQMAMPDDSIQRLRSLNEKLEQTAQTKGSDAGAILRDYRIGTEDLIDISVFEVPELSRTVRVSAAGEISLPLIGAVKVAGQSPLELERSLTGLLRESYVKDPQVTVFLREFHSDPVSVVGAVKMPGLYHIQTTKSLIEVLAMAQGFTEGPSRLPGRDIVITHKARSAEAAPHDASASSDSAYRKEQPSIEEVPIKNLMESGDPKWNVTVYPGDVVKVVPAGTVYVAGDVTRPGGFPLTDFDNISTIQALSMAGGTLKTANRKEALVIRRDAAGNRVEQKINLGRVLDGKDPDQMLGPNDILFVPDSVGKAAGLRALETAIQTGTGLLIWGKL